MNQPVTEPKRSWAGCLTTAFVIFLLVSCARIARFGPRIMDELIPSTPLPRVYVLPPSYTLTPRPTPAVTLTVSAALEKHKRLPAQLVGQPTLTAVVTVTARSIGSQQPERLGKVNDGPQPVQGKPKPVSSATAAEYRFASGRIAVAPPKAWEVQHDEEGFAMWHDPEQLNAITLRWLERLDLDLSQLSDNEFLGQVERIADAVDVEIGPVIRSTMSGSYALTVDLLTDLGDISYRSVFTVLVFDGTWILVESVHPGDEALPEEIRLQHAEFIKSLRSTELQTVQPSKPEPDPIDNQPTLFTRRVELETIPISVTVPVDWIKGLDSEGQVVFINTDETIFWGLVCIPGKDMRLYDVDDETVERIMTERVLIDFGDIGPIQIHRSDSYGFAAVSAETTIIDGRDTFQTLTNFERVENLNCTIGFYRIGISALTDVERKLADQLIDSIEPRP